MNAITLDLGNVWLGFEEQKDIKSTPGIFHYQFKNIFIQEHSYNDLAAAKNNNSLKLFTSVPISVGVGKRCQNCSSCPVLQNKYRFRDMSPGIQPLLFTYCLFNFKTGQLTFSCLSLLLLLTHQVVLTLQPRGLQHTRFPCSSLSRRVCSNCCPLSG